jgi:hypothetical protein
MAAAIFGHRGGNATRLWRVAYVPRDAVAPVVIDQSVGCGPSSGCSGPTMMSLACMVVSPSKPAFWPVWNVRGAGITISDADHSG